ncbi:MAG: transporter [bacterium]
MRPTAFVAALVLALSLPVGVSAEEGGSGHYMPGGFASFVDVLPGKPGLGVFNSFTYYSGDASRSRTFIVGGQVTASLDATVYVDTTILLYETPLEILGGGYGLGIAVPVVWVEATGEVSTPFGSRSMSDSARGLGDITIFPLMLVWQTGSFKYGGYFGIYAPTGDYDVGKLANVGKNYWTFEPTLYVNYFGKKGQEVTAFAGYDVNTENKDTHYESGDAFHLDATFAQHLPLFDLGLVGVGANAFYYKQVTGDSGAGAVLGKLEDRTGGIGPVLSFAAKLGKTQWADLVAEAKWLPELEVNRRLKGDIVWFKLAVLF